MDGRALDSRLGLCCQGVVNFHPSGLLEHHRGIEENLRDPITVHAECGIEASGEFKDLGRKAGQIPTNMQQTLIRPMFQARLRKGREKVRFVESRLGNVADGLLELICKSL